MKFYCGSMFACDFVHAASKPVGAVLIIAAAIAVSFECSMDDVCGQSRISLTSTQDAHVDRRKSNVNFGDAAELEIKKSATEKGGRRCFLQFDLSRVKKPIRFAVLDCNIVDRTRTPIVVKSSDQRWQESRITWNNSPGEAAVIAEVPTLGGADMLVDVTASLQKAQRAKLPSVTFVLEAKQVTQKTIRVASRENGREELRPELMLEFENANDPLKTVVTYTETEKGAFAGLGLGEIAGQQPLGKYGGWKEWSLAPSGFFRTQQLDGYWMLVDPEGHAFFGLGLNSVRQVEALKLPRDVRAIGFNHMASWSDESIKKFPYTPRWNFILRFKNSDPEFKRNYLEKDLLPVFEPSFKPFVERIAAEAGKLRDNPWVLGHFTDNEIPFHKTVQLKESLRLPRKNAQHQAARKWLQNKYGHDVQSSNITIGDEREYMGVVVDHYYAIVTSALRKHVPNHLVLGERLHASAKFNPHVIEAAGKHCDVISINFYGRWAPSQSTLAMWREKGNKPFLITEFYTKATDSGLENKNGAGWVVPSQRERVQHFENFALRMLGTPHCVGLHWFRFVDDDGSNKGVFDGQFKPYQELQDSIKNASRQMYRLRSKQLFGNLDFNGSVK